MDLPDSVLGHYQATQLRARATVPALVLGPDTLMPGDLARVGCFHPLACARLQRALVEIRAKSLQHVFDAVPPTALAVPGIGVVALAVLGAAFEAKKIGGSSPLVAWVKRHSEGHTITFSALKDRVISTPVPRATAADRKARARKRSAA